MIFNSGSVFFLRLLEKIGLTRKENTVFERSFLNRKRARKIEKQLMNLLNNRKTNRIENKIQIERKQKRKLMSSQKKRKKNVYILVCIWSLFSNWIDFYTQSSYDEYFFWEIKKTKRHIEFNEKEIILFFSFAFFSKKNITNENKKKRNNK